MAHRIVWSRRALEDLEAIANYIAADSPAYAKAVVTKVIAQTRTLPQFPRAGRKVPEFDNDDVRELIVYSYRIIYQLRDNHVVVSAVIHGKRMFEQP